MQIEDRTKIDARIAGAFKAASDATGTSFDRLVKTAARESDLRPDLAAKTSSAKGLYQFVDQTWLELVKKEGPSVGLERQAEAITADGKGGYAVADPREKAKILALRADPLVSSIMAGRFTASNTAKLTESLGRAPSDGEVYAAHVLGASGATKLVRMAETEPTTTAAVAFPKAAAANPGLFYGKDGRPVTASDLLSRLSGTSADVSNRIAEAHAALPTEATAKLDPKTLAAVVRAQAAATVAGEGLAAGADALTATRLTRTSLTEKSLPGSSRDVVPPTGPRIDGWRAKTTRDAFSALMRSDADAAPTQAATTDPTAEAARPLRFSATDASAQKIGGAAGGIAYVDPSQPLRLGAGPVAMPVATTAPVGRPSRLMTAAAAGAPDLPLPMVDRGAGVVQPSRVGALAVGAATTTAAEVQPSGLVAAGAARVKTVSIAPATSSATTADRPLLPPVPGERAEAAAPPVPAATARTSARTNRPLDLLGLQRRANGS